MHPYIFREHIVSSDLNAIEEIIRSSGFFSAQEIEIACELARDRLDQGEQSSYQFLFLEDQGKVVGYTCYGLIPATAGSYDLYWIAVAQHMRGRGLGRILMQKTEERIMEQSGRAVYVETSSRAQYIPTQRFYEQCNYAPEATLNDFYAIGDSKIIYSKILK